MGGAAAGTPAAVLCVRRLWGLGGAHRGSAARATPPPGALGSACLCAGTCGRAVRTGALCAGHSRAAGSRAVMATGELIPERGLQREPAPGSSP